MGINRKNPKSILVKCTKCGKLVAAIPRGGREKVNGEWRTQYFHKPRRHDCK